MRSKLTVTGLILAGLSLGAAVHANELGSCPTIPAIEGISSAYDAHGRLSILQRKGKVAGDVEEEVKERVLFTYAPHFTSVLHTGVVAKLEKPSKYTRNKNNSVMGPIRDSDYDANTGELMRVGTYEKMKINPKTGAPGGYQATYEIPAGIDFSKFAVNEKGNVVYKGSAELLTIFGDRKPYLNKDGRNEHELELTEPLNLKTGQCYAFAGALFPLVLPAEANPQVQPKINGQPKESIKRVGNRIETPEGYIEIVDDDEAEAEMVDSFEGANDAEIDIQ